MKIFLYCLAALGALILLLLAVVLIRALRFKPKANVTPTEGEETVDRDRVVSNLQTLVRFKTVSYRDHSLEDDAEFENMIAKLPELYRRRCGIDSVERCACDFISGMTDRYAIEVYTDLCIPKVWKGTR